MLEWKRPKTRETIIAKHRVIDSKCGLYRVVEWTSELGGPEAYPVRWFAILLMGAGRILGEHRTQGAAVATCERHSKT